MRNDDVTYDTVAHDTRHGGAYDRGAADAYYGRAFAPHYYEGGTYKSFAIFPREGTPEWESYKAGYNECDDRKIWD